MHNGGVSRAEPLISVCIPTFNSERFLGQTVASALRCEWRNLEVIVSDDASTDRTVAVCRDIEDPRLRIFEHGDRRGAPANWNRAMGYAKGELLCLLNHDDVLGPSWLPTACRGLSLSPDVGWAVSAHTIVDHAGKRLSTATPLWPAGIVAQRDAFQAIAALDGLGPAAVIRRSAFEAVRGYCNEAGASADNDIFLRLAVQYPLVYSDFPHNAWRFHSGNLTHRWTPAEQFREGFTSLSRFIGNPDWPEWVAREARQALRVFNEKCMLFLHYLESQGEEQAARAARTALEECAARHLLPGS